MIKMNCDYLLAYQSFSEYPKKITSTRIAKVSYLLKLNAQRNSISDLDRKHKAWGGKSCSYRNTFHIEEAE